MHGCSLDSKPQGLMACLYHVVCEPMASQLQSWIKTSLHCPSLCGQWLFLAWPLHVVQPLSFLLFPLACTTSSSPKTWSNQVKLSPDFLLFHSDTSDSSHAVPFKYPACSHLNIISVWAWRNSQKVLEWREWVVLLMQRASPQNPEEYKRKTDGEGIWWKSVVWCSVVRSGLLWLAVCLGLRTPRFPAGLWLRGLVTFSS